jgi:hypothetical protein
MVYGMVCYVLYMLFGIYVTYIRSDQIRFYGKITNFIKLFCFFRGISLDLDISMVENQSMLEAVDQMTLNGVVSNKARGGGLVSWSRVGVVGVGVGVGVGVILV